MGADERDGCAHYYADPSGGFDWPKCVKCGIPVPVETAHYALRACCQTTLGAEHARGCASLDARQRRAARDNRHVMIEREFADNPPSLRMTMADSGLVSEDVWWEMVTRLLDERGIDARHPSSLSRGRHHA